MSGPARRLIAKLFDANEAGSVGESQSQMLDEARAFGQPHYYAPESRTDPFLLGYFNAIINVTETRLSECMPKLAVAELMKVNSQFHDVLAVNLAPQSVPQSVGQPAVNRQGRIFARGETELVGGFEVQHSARFQGPVNPLDSLPPVLHVFENVGGHNYVPGFLSQISILKVAKHDLWLDAVAGAQFLGEFNKLRADFKTRAVQAVQCALYRKPPTAGADFEDPRFRGYGVKLAQGLHVAFILCPSILERFLLVTFYVSFNIGKRAVMYLHGFEFAALVWGATSNLPAEVV